MPHPRSTPAQTPRETPPPAHRAPESHCRGRRTQPQWPPTPRPQPRPAPPLSGWPPPLSRRSEPSRCWTNPLPPNPLSPAPRLHTTCRATQLPAPRGTTTIAVSTPAYAVSANIYDEPSQQKGLGLRCCERPSESVIDPHALSSLRYAR